MQIVTKDKTATLVAYPPRPATVSSATVRFQTPSTSLTDAAAATLDSSTWAIATAASEGDTLLTVDDYGDAEAPIVGRRYVVRDQAYGGEPFFIEVAAFDSTANTIRCEQPIPRALAVGASVEGCALTTSLTTAHTSTIGDGSAEWTVTYLEPDLLTETVAVPFTTSFRVVKRESQYSLTWSALTQMAPELEHQRPPYDDTGAETLTAAWRRHVAPALAQRGIVPGRIIDPEWLEPAHVAAVDYLLHPADEMRRDEFYSKVEQAVTARGFWYDEEQDLSQPDDVVKPISMGLVR